jgi:hypothetical protein
LVRKNERARKWLKQALGPGWGSMSEHASQLNDESMTAATISDPVFVHASARGGSTYFFNVLRHNNSFLCFSSAIIDGKKDIAWTYPPPKPIIRRKAFDANHQFLDRPDFYEFIEAWDDVMHLCPDYPTFRNYLPPDGVLSSDIRVFIAALIEHAQSQNKRPILCETNSRGRAGALRDAFGGFHIAQYRDPLSQFGSFIRALVEGGFWGFLSHPATELGVCGSHPLYAVVPAAWRVPNLPWVADTRAKRWASDAQYIALIGSSEPGTIEKVFRWHLFSWVLSNLAAMAYSDLAVDMDRIHDDVAYRASIIDSLAAIEVPVDFKDLKRFDRYYEFESFSTATVCNQVVSTIKNSLADGTLERALRTLGRQPPVTPTASAVDCLLTTMNDSFASMAASPNRQYITTAEWKAIVTKHRKIWFNPGVRRLTKRIYPLAAPIVHAARRAGLWT